MASKVLVTGSAGFIGFHTVRELHRRTDAEIVGVDNFDPYYDPQLKHDRMEALPPSPRWTFEELDLTDRDALQALFRREDFDRVVHLAALPGARASSEQPNATVRNNIDAFLSVLEACRHHGVEHLVYASSSSVYGRGDSRPSAEADADQTPVSLYAATKVSNEAMAHSYAHLYDIPTTGLRFFTVYGPWGRPDMAYYLFADAIADGRTLELFNGGEMKRDFTYVADVAEAVRRVLSKPPDCASREASVPCEVYNVGRGTPVELETFVRELEDAVGREAEVRYASMPPSDVQSTHADPTAFAETFGFRPEIDLREGLQRFADWHRDYHG